MASTSDTRSGTHVQHGRRACGTAQHRRHPSPHLPPRRPTRARLLLQLLLPLLAAAAMLAVPAPAAAGAAGATSSVATATATAGGGGGGGGAAADLSASSTPWLLPASMVLPYEGLHNRAEVLLRLQATHDGWVSVFMFSDAVSWWTLNCVHSYIQYGASTSYVVAAPDEASLLMCTRLRLPCLNMSAMGLGVAPAGSGGGGGGGGGGALQWRSAAYYSMVWAKVALVRRVLELGHHVHFSDVDVVYLRQVWPSYRRLFATSGPDAIFMSEQWQQAPSRGGPGGGGGAVAGLGGSGYVNLFNTGVYAMRSNPRSLAFMDLWYGNGTQQQGNQIAINDLAFGSDASFAFCQSAPECNLLRRRGLTALLLHPSQSTHAGCPPRRLASPADACDDGRLFIHFICSPDGWGLKGRGSKGTMLNAHALRLLDARGSPAYARARGGARGAPLFGARALPTDADGRALYEEDEETDDDGVSAGDAASGLPPHPFLPCPPGPAWARVDGGGTADQKGVAWPADPIDT
ncbi:hypothetical protein FOA52_012781 [Chlamydomonas sp. UWO 241]|nr:hypothetical protein FOA52_012781 [Chlamydomonas sp. UWO 241]